MTTSAANSKRPRAVLDTNILISALVFGGKPRQVVELFIEYAIDIVISHEILTELRRKIRIKFPSFIKDLERFEALLERDAQQVLLGSVNVAACRDDDDNRIIETALIGKCSYIISGDKDLLILKNFQGIQIITPAEFLLSMKIQPIAE